jgi:hypothetical protein
MNPLFEIAVLIMGSTMFGIIIVSTFLAIAEICATYIERKKNAETPAEDRDE